ncbi:MAG: glycoside hydrolase family 88 protein [Dysgonamonadaceae bacterium]|jgi:unsaturated chondroitin disaccharide hydrolase|nr:glycoside hydrolase family 88 protein [Dysgonamonadaceae bacterium]
MFTRKKLIPVVIAAIFAFAGIFYYSCYKKTLDKIAVDQQLSYCHEQVKRTLFQVQNDSCQLPRNINHDAHKWYMVNVYDWTSGFFPGILWYVYENSGDKFIRSKAEQYTACLAPLLHPDHWGDHDLGFQYLCSFGNAYRLTGDEYYKECLLTGAGKLARHYNPKVGTIQSWAHMKKMMGWPHNTIMDNMMNIELLFWAARNGGNPEYAKMAETHARKTMENQFKPDYTNFHVAIYDTINGNLLQCVTNQGCADSSFWARGQAWAIYGFTMVYRETGIKEFLRFAEKITDVYLQRLPEDQVPYWDFEDPKIPDAPKDASAAAIVASALLELSTLEDSRPKTEKYFAAAERMLESLSSDVYLCGNGKPAFLLHSTGNLPGGYEIDASITYADYYYLEALTRYKTKNRK